MKSYIEISAYHIGNMHMQKNLPCEDFSLSYSDDKMCVAVISDGHGDKNCFRSSDGAIIACETAAELCKKFYITAENMMNEYGIEIFEQILSELEAEIAKIWKQSVLEDFKNNPFTEKEILTASEKMQDIYRLGEKIEKAYGCTLIIAVVTDKYWFGLQIGDGRCVATYDDGIFLEPIPKDEENCVANYSTSLCSENAELLFRHYFGTVLPRAVFVFSDGVEESFDQSGLYNCLYSINIWLAEDYEKAEKKINELLPKISEGGSGDDVSISAIVSTEKMLSKPRKTMEQVEELVSAYAGNLEKCENDLENIYREISNLNSELKSAKEKIKQLEEKIARKQEEIENYEENQNKAYEQMEKAYKYKSSADTFWKTKLKQLGMEDLFADE